MRRRAEIPWGLRIVYEPGSYRQDDLRRRHRLADEDVPRFVLWWTQGRAVAWMAQQLGQHHLRLYSHAQRLAEQGIIPVEAAIEPCRYWQGERMTPSLVVTARGGVRKVWPYMGAPEFKGRGGRPQGSRNKATLEAAGASYVDAEGVRQRPGISWRQLRAERLQQEAAEREATKQAMDVRPSSYQPPAEPMAGMVPTTGDIEHRRARNARRKREVPQGTEGAGSAPEGRADGSEGKPEGTQRRRRRNRKKDEGEGGDGQA
jgi:hypothetical protein